MRFLNNDFDQIMGEINHILGHETYTAESLLSLYKKAYVRLTKDFSHYAAYLIALKAINIIVSENEKKLRKTKIANRPMGLIVDPANGCLLNCPGCVHTLSKNNPFDWPNGILPKETFEKFLDIYGPYACSAYLYNYGEPFLHPKMPELIRTAKNYLMGASISSNLASKQLDCREIVLSGLDYLLVSLDGVSQDVYSTFRRNGDVETVFNNLRSLIAFKKETGSHRPWIAWRYLVFEHNYCEIDAAKEIATSIGVDELLLANPWSVAYDDPSIVVKEDYKAERLAFSPWRSFFAEDVSALPAISENQLDFTLFENIIPTPVQKGKDVPASACNFLYSSITMDANCRILPCCAPPSTGVNLVYDTFTGNNYSWNNETFVNVRTNAFSQAGKPEGIDTPHCYKCLAGKSAGLFDTPSNGFNYFAQMGHAGIRNFADILKTEA